MSEVGFLTDKDVSAEEIERDMREGINIFIDTLRSNKSIAFINAS